jgi:acetyl esterase
MPLDPQARFILDTIAALNLPELWQCTPEEAREQSRMRAARIPPGPDVHVEDHRVPGPAGDVLVRVYRPLGSESTALPVLVWFHGGGFVIGSVAESDAVCRTMAATANVAVASVEYRLAPEHPYPAAPDDCYAGLEGVVANATKWKLDPNRVAVGGDSAGGNLATVVCLMARDRGGPKIHFQALVYPVTDSVSIETPSHLENADGYFLTRKSVIWFREHYVPDEKIRDNPYVSPLHAADLRGLPPAWIITAEYDPLRDEAETYAKDLERAAVRVAMSRYDGMIHGFFSMYAFLDAGRRAHNEMANVLAKAFAT